MKSGDKESYWLGFEVVGDSDYAFYPGQLGTMGVITQMSSSDLGDNQPTLHTSKEKSLVNQRPIWKHSSNVTICAPQLLHLDRNGNPMWFNGWILMDKFDNMSQTLIDFQEYMLEPSDLRNPEAWQIGDHNLACLTNDHSAEFTKSEKEVLVETIKVALSIGAYKPGTPPAPQVNYY